MATLDGIRVIDLTHFEAGPFCTEMLAFLGADVIKIERPGGDQQRRRIPRPPGDDPDFDSYPFMVLNESKRGICIDLTSEEGREIVLRLCENADVFIENFAPGRVESYGLDYDTLNKINPRIIFAQIKGFDPNGPYGNYKSMNAMVSAMAGVMATTGYPDDPPLLPGPHVADTGTGLHMALGIVAALYKREQTGLGERVRVAMQEAAINLCRPAYAKTFATGKAALRQGNATNTPGVGSEFYESFPGGPNDYVMIGLQRAKFDWDAMFDLIERPEAKSDPRFANAEQRSKHWDELHKLVSSWTRRITKMEAMRIMEELGIPAGAVLDTHELSSDPHLTKNGTFASVEHPERGPIVLPGFPVRIGDAPAFVGPPPLVGQHTKEVLTELLNLTADDLERLRQSGVIGIR